MANREALTGKIVLVHNTMHYLRLHYTELIEELLKNDWMVHCVAPLDDATAAVESMGVKCTDLGVTRRGVNPFREMRTIAALYRIFRRERPDCVLNFSIKPSIYGSLAARLTGVGRVCSMITGLGYIFLGNGPLRRILSEFATLAYKAALSGNRWVFFQNPDDRDFFLKRRILARARCVVLPGTGVDTERFAPRQPNPGDHGAGTGFLVVARLLSDKGLREFVEAARILRGRCKDVRCAVLGPYDDNPAALTEREIKSWVNQGAVSYLGEAEDVAPIIARYDVFVLPSYREGLPRAILEAMSMGKPIITTDAPGCRETVADGVNGFLVPPRDAGSLAAAMARFMDDPSLVRTMGLQSRAIAVRKFDVHTVNRTIIKAVCDGV